MKEFFASDFNYYYLTIFAYILAAVFYGINFFLKDKFQLLARGLALFGAVVQLSGMIFRWVSWGNPIFTSLFEMLLWFTLGTVIIMLVAEMKFKYRDFGFFVLPFVIILMAVMLLLPNRESGSTMPALQSTWLYIHVAVAIVSYAAFLAGFSAAIMFFIKNKVRTEWFAFIASLFTLIVLVITNSGTIITKLVYRVTLMGPDGIPVTAEFRITGITLFLAAALFALSTIFTGFSLLKPIDDKKKKGNVSGIQKLAKTGFLTASIAQLLGTLFLLIHLIKHETLSLASQPAQVAFFIACVVINMLVLLVLYKSEKFHERLPSEELLDNLQYFTVKFGFPFLTLTIITGAIWANRAWGSYWGNDPKEWAAAVTWLVYAAYLHMRFTKGWSGMKAALILVIGFLAVMFTLIGVTYLASGLHAYA